MLKSFWHRRAYKKRLAEVIATKSLAAPHRINKVRVLLDASLAIEKQFFIELAKSFAISPVNISIFVFPSGNPVEGQYSDFFNPDDIGYFGHFQGDLASICSKDVDLQINYFNTASLHMQWVAVAAKHKMSVGFSDVEQQINDLIFDFTPTDKNTFKEELIKYLTILKKI